MSFIQAFRNLPPRTRLGIGFGFIAWSIGGMYLSDKAEKKLGYEPSEGDRERLREAVLPKVSVVERDEGR